MNIDWNHANYLVDSICAQVRESNFIPTHIIGVARGGLCPAVMMSHKLNAPMTSYHLSYRDDGVGKEYSDMMNVTNLLNLSSHSILIVEDINDTGKTLKELSNRLHKANLTFKTATLIEKPTSIFRSDYYAHLHELEDWVIFPWENS